MLGTKLKTEQVRMLMVTLLKTNKMVIFITFGQTHTHSHNGFTLDKDCVGVIHCRDYDHGRELAFEWFGDKFATTYAKINNEFMNFFPKGTYDLN